MKDYKEMAQSVFERRDAYLDNKKKQKQFATRFGIPAICLLLVTGLSFMVLRMDFQKQPVTPGSSLIVGTDSQTSQVDPSLQSSAESVNSVTVAPSSLPASWSSLPSSTIKTESDVIEKAQTNQSVTSVQAQQTKPGASAPNAQFPSLEPDDSEVPPCVESPKTTMYYYSYAEFVLMLDKTGLTAKENGSFNIGPSSVPSSTPSTSPPQGGDGMAGANGVESDYDSYYPEYDPPMVSPPEFEETPVENIDVWKNVWPLFEEGVFMYPKALQSSTSPFILASIAVDADGLYFDYLYRDPALQSDQSYDLRVKTAVKNSTLFNEFNQYKSRYGSTAYTVNDVRYYVSSAPDSYHIFWNLDGTYYGATYYGDELSLPSLLKDLVMSQYIWN